MSLAMLEYRQGNFDKAVQWCRKSLSYSDSNEARFAGIHALWAMSAYQLGQESSARAELANAREFFKAPFLRSYTPRGEGQGLWLDWLIARVLIREAAALVEPVPPATKRQ
jgi:hypothetical protein